MGALARAGSLSIEDLLAALTDPAAEVRRRACDLSPLRPAPAVINELVRSLSDGAGQVAEAACYALGELAPHVGAEAVGRLCATAMSHTEPLCREAAVAALGALGNERGLPAVLKALTDKPAVRRRAVVALAAFEGPEVDAALERCLEDHDWQVRQVAEDLLGRRPGHLGPHTRRS